MDTLTKITLKNFQSFADSEVELSPGFSAIVGPSNLGKSALIRAIKALARNAPAPGLVREGTKELSVSAEFASGTIEQLTKGAKKSVYDLTYPDGRTINHAKAGANSVPDEVAELWQLPAPDGRELAFATQHEPPFLLAEPASAVAKVLGDLTNAAVLMQAVQEANKRRSVALADEKARTREVDETREELLTHKGLSARVKAVETSERALSVAKDAYYRFSTVTGLLSEFSGAKSRLERAEAVLRQASVTTDALTEATKAVHELQRLEQLIGKYQTATLALDQAVEVAANATLAKSELETKIHDLLSDAGICPLCSQAVV